MRRATARGRADALLDALLAAFASWTLVYHACVTLRLGTTVALIAFLPVLAVAVTWSLRAGTPRERFVPRPEPRRDAPPLLHLAGAALALAGAVLFAYFKSDVAWTVPWALWIAAAGCGVAAVLWRRGAEAVVGDERFERAGTLAWVLVCAALALLILNPDDDDSYYLQLTGWIAETGVFPVRDVFFSDQVLPALYWPPAGSWDPLLGSLARLTGLSAPSVAYYVAGPAVAGLAVLALRRLLRSWAVPSTLLALSVAIGFLLCFAATNPMFGSFFVGRSWQGKTALLIVLVPVLLAQLHDYGRTPSATGLARLALLGVAAVGLSTTGIFLVPLIAFACMAALALQDRIAAALGLVAAAAYPVGAAVVTKLTGGRVPDIYVDADVVAGDLVHLTLYRGTVAAVAVAAILIAPALIPRRLAARMVAAIVLLVGVLYTPGVPLAIFHVTDLGRVLWRLMWAVPVAALVGTLAVRLVPDRFPPLLRLVPAVAIVAALALSGTPPWGDRAARGLVWPPVYKRFPDELASARAAVRAAGPGEIVWSTRKVEQTIGILEPRVRTVNARGFFTTALEDEPAALVPERKRLHNVITYGLDSAAGDDVPGDLRTLGVDVACPLEFQTRHIALLENAGWTRASSSPDVICLRAPSA